MLLIEKAFVTTFLLLPMCHRAYGRKLYAYFETLDCSHYDRNYIETVKCWLEPDRRGQLTMNAALKLKQDLDNIMCKYQFIIELNNRRNITFLSLDTDACAALGLAFKIPILRLTTEELRRMSNLPLECPLKRGVEYVIQNYTIVTKFIPPFTPQMKWVAHSQFYTNSTKEKILQYVCSGRVDHIKPKAIPTA